MANAHAVQTPANGIHVAIAYDVADATARGALSLVAADVGKLLLQRDTKQVYMLVGTGPVVWLQIADAGLTDNTQPGNYTLTVAAPQQLTRMTSAAAHVLTVPPDASALVPLLQPVPILRAGTGITTLTAGGGVTLRPANNLRLATQWDLVTLMRIGANEWLVKGDAVP